VETSIQIDWNTFLATAPLGLLGLFVVGFSGWIAIRANGGLVRVAERLVEAIAAIQAGQQLPKGDGGDPRPEPLPELPPTQPTGPSDSSGETTAAEAELNDWAPPPDATGMDPDPQVEVEVEGGPDEFPPHRLAEILDEFPPPIRRAASKKRAQA